MKKKVYIKDGTELQKAIGETFKDFGFNTFDNKRVFVKPNMLRIARPEECIITDPKLIEAVVDYLLSLSANITVGDNPIPQKVNELDVAKECGFLSASRGRFKNIGRYVKKVRIRHNRVKNVYVSRDILDAELLISLPKFKVHTLTMLSIAIKNQFGIIPGGLKPYLHYQCPTLDDFCRLLIEIYNLKKPNLIIVDALNTIDAKGRLFKFNKLIAGDDAWAIDYVCTLLAGMNPHSNPILRLGLKDKFFEPEDIEIIGDATPIKGFAVPFSLPIRDIFAGIGSRVFAQFQHLNIPVIDHNLCNKCRSCENVCPAKAIERFNIDHKTCIRCYCCFEVCPQNAIKRRLRIV